MIRTVFKKLAIKCIITTGLNKTTSPGLPLDLSASRTHF